MAPELMAFLILTTSICVYALLCWVAPFGKHRRCHGTGTRTTLIFKRLKPCHGCQGSGLVLRYGRRAYNLLAAATRDAHPTRRRP